MGYIQPPTHIHAWEEEDGAWHEVTAFRGSLNIIDHRHQHIHDGDTFMLTVTSTQSKGSTYNLHIHTPDSTQFFELYYTARSENETHWIVYEGSTYTSTTKYGTAVTAYNRNRASTDSSTIQAYHTPNFGSCGTPIQHARSGSGNKAGGQVEGLTFMLLKPNEHYLLYTSAIVAGWIAIQLDWIESND